MTDSEASSPHPTPTERLYAIAEQGLCIGCGLCQAVAGPETVSVTTTPTGYQRPVVVGPIGDDTVDLIYDICPGTRVDGLPGRLVAADTTVDPVWGPWRRMVTAWAGDPEVRFEGSTGGVLTALGQYVLSSARVDAVLHVRASAHEPTFGEPTLSFTPSDVLTAAGSRYGPTPTLLNVTDVLDGGQSLAVVGKPCDLSALRNWARHDPRVDKQVRYWLTMVCGGFGTPAFTNRFLTRIGIDRDDLTSFRYRGRGCPGPTRAETADRVVERHYLDYWGDDATAWQLPWRCKICPDGIGESADLAAADSWPGGSPTREESADDPGVNAVIARTVAGQELLEAAAADGALVLDRDLSPDDLSRYQPHQVRKKQAVAARFGGLAETNRIVPTTNRLRLAELSAEVPVEVNLGQRRGTIERIEMGKATEPTPEPASGRSG